MKATLTADDPIGWYLCRRIHAKHLCCNWWDREHLRSSPLLGELNLSLYEDFRRLFTESDVAALREELRTLREANERLSATLLEASAELSRLKSQPYEMRRADKPDCEGLWRKDKQVRYWEVTDTEQGFPDGPWFYVGPIPVIVEQQPPRVVTIRNKRTGKESLAIPQMRDGKPEYYFLLLADGTVSGERVWCNNWEAAQ